MEAGRTLRLRRRRQEGPRVGPMPEPAAPRSSGRAEPRAKGGRATCVGGLAAPAPGCGMATLVGGHARAGQGCRHRASQVAAPALAALCAPVAGGLAAPPCGRALRCVLTEPKSH